MQPADWLWQFLTQPVFCSTKVILNPIWFWNHYNIQFLERCWNHDLAQRLECCWVKDLELESPSDQSWQK
jgi:hypothetical protein